ncbi:MAG: cyclic nucleotide-binding domain-containing protein [Elusimicrobiota bacterium]|jgi:CRP-like cAMP-binding protein
MAASVRESLKSIELLSQLPDSVLGPLADLSAIRPVRAGETIFCQNEPSPYCFGILSGEVLIQRVSKDPRFPSKVLGVLGPGDLFGESALLENCPRAAMATANKDGELLAIQGNKFREWLVQEPALGVPVLINLLDRSLSRLQLTSHELSIVYGVGRLLSGPQPFQDRLAAGLEFVKSSIDGLDDLYCFERSAYWEEFGCLYPTTEPDRLPAIPLASALAAKAQGQSSAFVLDEPDQWQAASAALVPLMNADRPDQPLQGFLVMTSRQQPRFFSRNMLLMLSAMANPLAEALARQSRQEEASAQSRLDQSRRSFNL